MVLRFPADGPQLMERKPVTPIRILLVDDSTDFLVSAERILTTDSQIEVVGRATSGQEALNMVSQLHPDLVLMDLSMPGMSGLEATRRIKSQHGSHRVVILTMHDDSASRAAADAVQADGFIGKSIFLAEIFSLIQRLFPRRPGAAFNS